MLSQETKFVIITMPQRASRRGTGLSEIMEELEECDEDAVEGEAEDDVASVASAETNSERADSVRSASSQGSNHHVQLNVSDDPLKRFQVIDYFVLF